MEPAPFSKAILLVDDDIHVRESIKDLLEKKGYSIFEAHSGASALNRLHQYPEIQLIISDFQMSEGDGLWLLEQARAHRTDIPFILITGNLQFTQTEALQLGINQLIHKPLQGSSQLLNSIRSLMS